MKKGFYFFILFLISLQAFSQYSIRFNIKDLPPNHLPGSKIYLAGSFNAWNPQNKDYLFQMGADSSYSISVKLPAGKYEYKITRGGWDKVECEKNGAGIANRSLTLHGDTAIDLSITEWQDHFPPKPRVSTANKHVHIIDTAFLIPQLNRTRRVWIYLPANYASTRVRYPVLYMQDGQNVFDDSTSYAGEWGVDEFMDSTKAPACIVVAIDNGGSKRLNEYCPYDFELKGIAATNVSGKGEGKLYVDFITNTLKNYIDRHYRTLKDRSHTYIAGSSMGGLVSLYALLSHPGIFGGAGIFSPAFWVGPGIFDDILKRGKKLNAKIYFYAGGQEGETMVPDMLKAENELKTFSSVKMTSVINEQARHNETAWRKEFPAFYSWLTK